jgi:hypothetical protein
VDQGVWEVHGKSKPKNKKKLRQTWCLEGSSIPVKVDYPSFWDFSRRLLLTTDTELSAIAAPAIIGFSMTPQIGKRMPAATGIPIRL